tara:strand:- start:868 stop:1041 length:174 start_codon:yes stop_codon:yes gene_type:complete
MSHHAHEESMERREEDRLEELYLHQLHQDHEFMEGVYASIDDDKVRQDLINKHYFGE